MHYGSTLFIGTSYLMIVTPGNGAVTIGRRTGGYDGNDASQIRQIYSCAVPFADNPSAVSLRNRIPTKTDDQSPYPLA